MKPDPLDYESTRNKQLAAQNRQLRSSQKIRLIARIVYFIVFGTLLFFAVRYLLNYFAMIDSLTRQRVK